MSKAKAQSLCKELRQESYLIPLEVMERAMGKANVEGTTIDLAGAMEKITPDMLDNMRDMMIETLTRQVATLTRQLNEKEVAQDQTQWLAELDKQATPGTFGQFSDTIGPWTDVAKKARDEGKLSHLDTSHHMSTVREDGTPYRIAEFHHAADAAFTEALVNAYRSGRIIVLPEGEDPAEKVAEIIKGECCVKRDPRGDYIGHTGAAANVVMAYLTGKGGDT